MYWNYFYHVWKTLSVSPFANGVVFVPGTPTVNSVTVTPTTATVVPGQRFNVGVSVNTTNFASQEVNWTIEAETKLDGTTVDIYGTVTIDPLEAAGNVLQVLATSVADPTKTDTCTLTVAQ